MEEELRDIYGFRLEDLDFDEVDYFRSLSFVIRFKHTAKNVYAQIKNELFLLVPASILPNIRFTETESRKDKLLPPCYLIKKKRIDSEELEYDYDYEISSDEQNISENNNNYDNNKWDE